MISFISALVLGTMPLPKTPEKVPFNNEAIIVVADEKCEPIWFTIKKK